MIQNEPIAAERKLKIFLVDSLGVGITGQSRAGGSTVQIRTATGAWVDSSADLVDRGFGAYELTLTSAEVSVVGPLWIRVVKANVFQDYYDVIDVSTVKDGTFYGLAAGGGVNYVTLPAGASVVDSFYAGGGQDCAAMIVAGTGAGQARLGTGYTGGNKQLAVVPNWVTAPDSTSVVKLVPYLGQLDNTVVTAITAAVWDVAIGGHVIAGSFGELLQLLAAMLHLNSRIDNTTFASDGVLTAARLRCFSSATLANASVAGHADNADGETFRFLISAVDVSGGQWSSFKLTRAL